MAALITITDIRTIRDVGIDFNETRLNAYINEVQDVNLRELLGCSFYNALIVSPASYTDLIEGEIYQDDKGNDIQYNGLKQFITYHVLALIATEGDIFHTNKGNRNFLEGTSEIDFKEKETIAKSYREKSLIYRNNIIDYLDSEIDAKPYPLWETRNKKNITDYSFQII